MRRGWGSVVVLGLALGACSSGDEPKQKTSSSEADETASAAASASASPAETALPTSVDDLTALIPRDASVVVGLPQLDGLKTQLGDSYSVVRDGVSSQLASKLGLSAATTGKLLDAYDDAAGFAMGEPKQQKLAVILRLKDGSIVAPALAEAKLEDQGKGRWTRGAPSPVAVAWLEQARVLVVASDDATLTAALTASNGESFKASPRYRARSNDAFFIAADTGKLAGSELPDAMDPGSKVLVAIELAAGGAGKLDVEYTQLGSKVPRLGLVLAPGSHASVGRLPGGALASVGLSLKRAPGKTLSDVFTELGRAGSAKLASDADSILQAGAKVSLADLDRALGDELAIGVYGSGERIQGFGREVAGGEDIGKQFVMVADITMRDDKVAAGLVDAAANALSVQKGFKPGSPGNFSMENAGVSVFVSASAGRVRIVMGGTKPATRIRDAASPVLVEQPSFKQAMGTSTKESQLLLFADIGAVAKVLPAEMSGQLAALGDLGTTLTITLKPHDKGIDLAAESAGGAAVAAVIGTTSAIAIYGVRRYLASAKTSEAKNTLGAIARGAISAFEREQATPPAHALCKSAAPVPATVPVGTRYTAQPGVDYDTGSATEGWKCLKFTMVNPQYYQYAYRVGADYKGPKRGGPNPGADGFEVSAEGDLDGDGVTSLFTLTGKVDKASSSIKLDTELFIVDEFE